MKNNEFDTGIEPTKEQLGEVAVWPKFMKLFRGDEETLVVAAVAGRIYGTVALQHKDRRAASICRLFVTKNYRRRKLGTYLVDECIRVARGSGCETLGLLVKKDNESAREFYRKIGFLFAYQYDNGDELMTLVL